MATPITWQNVNAPSNDAAMRGIESAQKGILGGMDRLSSTWADGVKISEDVAARGRQASQEEYLNLVQSYKTPEELQAARMSGVLDQRLASLDPRNQAAVRGAQEARITSLQTQTTAGDTYAKGQKTTADAPMIEQHAQMVANNDTVGAAALRATNPNVNWGNSAQVAQDAKRLRSSQDRTDAVDLAGQPGKLAAIAQSDAENAINYPVDLANATAKAALASGARAQAIQQQRLTGIDLENQQRTADQEVEDLKIAESTARFATISQQRTAAVRTGYGVLAKVRGFALAPDGGPDRSRMTNSEIAILTAAGKAAGMPAFDTMFSGNTQSAAALRASLKAQGFSDRGIANAGDLINGAADTSSVGALVGNDRVRAATAQATTDVMQEETDSRNRFAPGSPDAFNTYEALAKELPDMIPADAVEDTSEIQAMLNRFASKGIKLKDGRYVTPSAQDIRGAVRAYQPKREWASLGFKGNWRDGRQAEDIEASLKVMLESTDVTTDLANAELSRKQNRDRAIRAKLQQELFPQKQ